MCRCFLQVAEYLHNRLEVCFLDELDDLQEVNDLKKELAAFKDQVQQGRVTRCSNDLILNYQPVTLRALHLAFFRVLKESNASANI